MTHHVDRIAHLEHLARQRERAELQDLRDDWHAQAAEDDRYTESDEA
ncbi:hypothetical protein HMPREF1484_00228 [Dermabacter sp. HFH0086]|nr:MULTISPECIES: hypothetical protein [Dermabacter]EPH17543.1 hypothetical protein HMPREF1484_00228 [Dermabacter sp. HFH0086]